MNTEIMDQAKEAVDAVFPIYDGLSLQLANWMEIAAQNARNADFYKDLLLKCAEHLGPEVFVSDDGSIQDEPLLLKVPELVKSRVELFAAVGRAANSGDDIPEEAWKLWEKE